MANIYLRVAFVAVVLAACYDGAVSAETEAVNTDQAEKSEENLNVSGSSISSATVGDGASVNLNASYSLPPLLSPYGSYPNPLQFNDNDRALFHPVVKFPMILADAAIPFRTDNHNASFITTTSVDTNMNVTDVRVGTKPTRLGRLLARLQSWIPGIRQWQRWRGRDCKRDCTYSSSSTENLVWIPIYRVIDFTKPTGKRELATDQERLASCRRRCQHPYQQRQKYSYTQQKEKDENNAAYAVGRYDEHRVGLYESELFDNTDNAVDGYAGQRTIHVGIDLDGPVHTPVYSFWHGIIHAVGYNDPLGDYGNVVVIRYELPPLASHQKGGDHEEQSKYHRRVFYALYGHLNDDFAGACSSTENNNKHKKHQQCWRVGQRVKRGQMVGRMGDIHENGGWFIPHVHFQLSIHPPETHDLPGVVSLEDRPQALVHYPDPRYVLGALY